MEGSKKLPAALLGAVFFNLAMIMVNAMRLPVLRYNPLDRAWKLTAVGGTVPMMYYGQILWSSIAALLASLLVVLLPARIWNNKAVHFTVGWLLLSSVLAVSYYVHANWP
ncbi:MAG: hypothetical protein GXP49_04895 [Deltaproteobacteria bacterium]|nr:hypothetical protein [Deltaproteobacteria bacterium]